MAAGLESFVVGEHEIASQLHRALERSRTEQTASPILNGVSKVVGRLTRDTHRVDLTQGNRNGKNGPIDTFLFTTRVRPDISEKEEYRLYRQALTTHVLTRKEMAGIDLKTILKAREAALALLKVNMQRQQKAPA